MSAQVATLYFANVAVLAAATAALRSKTSGARSWPFRFFAAVISSWLDASGWAEFTFSPYFFVNALITAP